MALVVKRVNDLDMETTENQIIKKFADNTKMAQFIEIPEDSAAFQVTLNKLGAWAERRGMQFNTAKCHVMHIGKSNPRNVYNIHVERCAADRNNGGEGHQSDCQL